MNPPRTPVEHFAAIRLCLCQAVAAQTGWGISLALIALIVTRIRGIGQRFARLAARIGAGRYAPRRRPTAPRQKATGPPRRPNKLPGRFAWLLPLVPGTAGFGSQLDNLFRDPEMAALLAAAPASMGRALRPLCWMLGVTPPPILAWKRPAPAEPPPADPPPAPPEARTVARAEAPPLRRPHPPQKPLRGAPSPPGSSGLRGPPLPYPA